LNLFAGTYEEHHQGQKKDKPLPSIPFSSQCVLKSPVLPPPNKPPRVLAFELRSTGSYNVLHRKSDERERETKSEIDRETEVREKLLGMDFKHAFRCRIIRDRK